MAEHGQGSWLEFWRRLTPTEIGPHQRWNSTPDWQAAFSETFGLPVTEFYADFSAWQHGEVLSNAGRVSPDNAVAQWIFGRVADTSGSPVAGIDVKARRVEDGIDTGWGLSAGTAADGSFALGVHQDGDYGLRVVIDDDCTRYYSAGVLVEERDDVSLISVFGADVDNIDIQLSPNLCGWHIRGRIVGPGDEPLAGISISACPTDNSYCNNGRSAADGSFTIAVDELGEYRIIIGLAHGCGIYHRSDGSTATQSDASLVPIVGSDVNGLLLRIPESMCAHQIRGSVTKADGQPLANTYIWASCHNANDRCVAHAGYRTEADGSFTITVPAEGRYRIQFALDGCTIYFSAGGLTTVGYQHLLVRVSDGDLHLNPRQIPAEMCARRISGRFVDVDGAPLADKLVNACDTSACNSGQTDAAGHFTIRVPSDSSYTFQVWLTTNDCEHPLAGQALGSSNNPVHVSGTDVTDITLHLPGTIEELCN